MPQHKQKKKILNIVKKKKELGRLKKISGMSLRLPTQHYAKWGEKNRLKVM